MWSYYGAKTNLVRLYPRPKYGRIIEPFAGSARYALEYFENEVILIDKYPVITSIWKWLQKCSEKDILSLPRRLEAGQTLDAFTFDCDEAKLFFSFIAGCGDNRPRAKPTARKTIDRPNHINYNLQRVAKNLFKIRHWEIKEGNYTDSPETIATWFIDPPYQDGGHAYVMSSKKIDFAHLAKWSMEREGLVIVCENTKASWMQFKPITPQRGTLRTTTEAIWCNEPTAYDYQPGKLF